MLPMYNYVLLKMSTWYSKHVEESNNIWRINNIQCITLVVLYRLKGWDFDWNNAPGYRPDFWIGMYVRCGLAWISAYTCYRSTTFYETRHYSLTFALRVFVLCFLKPCRYIDIRLSRLAVTSCCVSERPRLYLSSDNTCSILWQWR